MTGAGACTQVDPPVEKSATMDPPVPHKEPDVDRPPVPDKEPEIFNIYTSGSESGDHGCGLLGDEEDTTPVSALSGSGMGNWWLARRHFWIGEDDGKRRAQPIEQKRHRKSQLGEGEAKNCVGESEDDFWSELWRQRDPGRRRARWIEQKRFFEFDTKDDRQTDEGPRSSSSAASDVDRSELIMFSARVVPGRASSRVILIEDKIESVVPPPEKRAFISYNL